jgi:molybdopterin converting factor small subunit
MVSAMSVTVHFYSYFKELTGCAQAVEEVGVGAIIAELMQKIFARFPRLVAMQNSTLVAVGVDYQNKDYVLQEGDEVSLFPPVQGG